MVHSQTISCVTKAESLLTEGTPDSLRYATLQLRMCIEYLFYELIPLYEEELPDDITTTKWQPRQIIDEILECDPNADKDGRLAISETEDFGSDSIVKEIKAPNRRLLRKHYHRLGSYLHAPVDLQEPDLSKWSTVLRDTFDSLKAYSSNQVLCNVRTLVELPCECGRTIKRNRSGVEASGEMRCPNPECRAVFDVTLEGDETRYTLRQTSYPCPYCRTDNSIPTHKVADGVPVMCVQCEKRVVIKASFVVRPLDGDPQETESQ